MWYEQTTCHRPVMGGGCPAAPPRASQAEGRAPARPGPRGPHRHPLCPQERHPLGDAAPGDGLRVRDDLLAAPARLGQGRRLGALAPQAVGYLGRGGPDRLGAGVAGFGQRARQKGGPKTGPNPTDRGKPGSKRHVVVDRRGAPLAVLLTAANVPDQVVFEELIEAIPPIKRPRGRPRRRPRKLHADKGYDNRRCRGYLHRRGIRCRIARKGIESKDRLGQHRWVVERTLAWLAKYRRLAIRYERRADIHEAFLRIACALICLNFVIRFC